MILNFDTFISSEFIEEISSLMEDIGRKEGRNRDHYYTKIISTILLFQL